MRPPLLPPSSPVRTHHLPLHHLAASSQHARSDGEERPSKGLHVRCLADHLFLKFAVQSPSFPPCTHMFRYMPMVVWLIQVPIGWKSKRNVSRAAKGRHRGLWSSGPVPVHRDNRRSKSISGARGTILLTRARQDGIIVVRLRSRGSRLRHSILVFFIFSFLQLSRWRSCGIEPRTRSPQRVCRQPSSAWI